MVAITGSTQYATQLDVTRSIRLLNTQLIKQNQQLGSGRYADGLIGVSPRALELGQLKSELGTINNYKSAVQSASNRVDLYALTIEEIIDIATDAQDVMIKNRDTFFASTSAPATQANVLLDRIGALLQTKDNDRFIFGGTNYIDNPMRGALSSTGTGAPPTIYAAGGGVPAAFVPSTGLTPITVPPAPYTAGAGGTFFYNPAPVAPAVPNNLTNIAGVTLFTDDNEQLSYGVSAAEPGFQRLIDSVIRFRDATQDIAGAPVAYQARVDDARAQLNVAISELKSIASRNGYKQQQLKEVMERHDRALDVTKVRAGAIENVDIGEVSVNIKNLQTSLEASYVITRDSLQMSLVKYLR